LSPSQRTILAVLTLTSLLTPFMGSSINVALPPIATEFQMSAMSLSWVAFSFLLASAVFLLPMGRAADLYGRARLFTIGIGGYVVTSFMCAVAPSGGWLIAARVLQGIGAAMIFGTSTAILSDVFPPGERGRALGITVSAVYFGLSAGPLFGGILTQQFGWRSIFYVNTAVALVILVFAVRMFPRDVRPRTREPFDLQGALVYGVSLCALMFGISLLPHINGALLVATGIIGLLVFIRWELRVPAPVLDVRLFRGNRVFGFSNLAALLNYSATAATAFLLSLYLQYTKGLTPQQAGTVLIVQPVIQAFLSPLAGRLSDRIEPRRVASLGMAMTAAGLGSFAFLTAETSQPLIIIGLAFLGVGFALFSSPNTNAIMGSVEPRHYGIASSAVATMRLTGQMFSTGIVMLLFALFIGDRALTPEVFEPFMQSLQTGFGVFALLCLLGIGASLARGRHPS